MKYLFILLALISTSFVFVMLINDDKPRAAFKRIETYTLDHLHLKQQSPPESPVEHTETALINSNSTTEDPTQFTLPSPKAEDLVTNQITETTSINPLPVSGSTDQQLLNKNPDPITWLIGNPNGVKQDIKIKQSIEFPAVYEGKEIGFIKKPTGTAVKIIGVHPKTVLISFNGGNTEVPIESTDLLEVATAEMDKQTHQIEKSNLTLETNSLVQSEPQIDIKSVLDKPTVTTHELVDLFSKRPTETANYLHSKIIRLSGLIEKIQILGIDSDRVEVTLNSLNKKRLVLKLKLENLIDKSKLEGSCKNQLSLENGQLKLISELIRSGSSYYYYYWNGYQYVRNYYTGGYYDGPYGYRHSGRSQALESPICSEGTEISNWSTKLNSTNSASIYFDVIKL